MLVLSRKPGERILIGEDIAVTIVRIGPNTVRLGIDAPRDMNIVREELTLRVVSDEQSVDDQVRALCGARDATVESLDRL